MKKTKLTTKKKVTKKEEPITLKLPLTHKNSPEEVAFFILKSGDQFEENIVSRLDDATQKSVAMASYQAGVGAGLALAGIEISTVATASMIALNDKMRQMQEDLEKAIETQSKKK